MAVVFGGFTAWVGSDAVRGRKSLAEYSLNRAAELVDGVGGSGSRRPNNNGSGSLVTDILDLPHPALVVRAILQVVLNMQRASPKTIEFNRAQPRWLDVTLGAVTMFAAVQTFWASRSISSLLNTPLPLPPVAALSVLVGLGGAGILWGLRYQSIRRYQQEQLANEVLTQTSALKIPDDLALKLALYISGLPELVPSRAHIQEKLETSALQQLKLNLMFAHAHRQRRILVWLPTLLVNISAAAIVCIFWFLYFSALNQFFEDIP